MRGRAQARRLTRMDDDFETGKRVASDPRTAARASDWGYRALALVGLFVLPILGIATILAARFGASAAVMCIGAVVLTSWAQTRAVRLLVEMHVLRDELLPKPIMPELQFAPPDADVHILLAVPCGWKYLSTSAQSSIGAALRTHAAALMEQHAAAPPREPARS